jgi:cyclopropane fatty-acyl-phospholipid synthase-like methyltransferase
MPPTGLATGYNSTYKIFDSPLMRQIRLEAYGEDIGQHSWVSAAELRNHIEALGLSRDITVLDFGCGPCGPLTFMAKEIGCKVVGVDLSAPALAAGAARARELGVAELIELHEADGNSPLNFANNFDAIVAFDVVLHLQDRANVFKGFPNLLTRKGKLLITDAGVVTGPISNEEIRLRSINGYTQFVPPGVNEDALQACGFKILSVADLTGGVIQNASGRIRAREKYAKELIEIEGEEKFREQQRYLDVVVNLSERKALSRFAYLAEVAG